jgi:hypothetical protein
MLLLAVAVLLSVSAFLAIGILLVGGFGRTEGRVLATTALLAGYGLVGLSPTILLDQRRWIRLALTGLGLAAVGASLAVVSVWTNRPSDGLGRTVGSVTAFALASAQACALTARRRLHDPPVVRRLFALSLPLAFAVASMFTALLWTHSGAHGYARLLGALAVLDLLIVALQPILARARPLEAFYRLRIVVEPAETLELDIEAIDLATAAAKAIRTVEHNGRRIVRLEVAEPAQSPDGYRGTLTSPRDLRLRPYRSGIRGDSRIRLPP